MKTMHATKPHTLKTPDPMPEAGSRATENTLSSTPSANRKHIAFFGNRNAGKSSLMNAILGQELSIVSEVRGTTTDPVSKAMELLPYGPVVFIDTAGLDDDDDVLGSLRVAKSLKILERTDFAVHVIDAMEASNNPEWLTHEVARLQSHFEKFSIPKLLVFNKVDLVMAEADGHLKLKQLKEAWPGAVWVSAQTPGDIHHLKARLIEALRGEAEDETLVGDLVPAGGTIVLVVPIDSEAPKGRLILPQVQVIRDALDHGLKVHVVRDTELVEALSELKSVDLVITDSQAFAAVSDMVPETIPLTSFSMVFARNKGDLRVFVSGIQAVKALEARALSRQKESVTGSEPIARILITESCTHNHSHEDIGRVKIPAMLNKKLGGRVAIEFKAGHDLPKDLSVYDLVVHCGSCMMNRKSMLTRIRLCEEAGTPITNYGVLLAYATGILNRCLSPYALG